MTKTILPCLFALVAFLGGRTGAADSRRLVNWMDLYHALDGAKVPPIGADRRLFDGGVVTIEGFALPIDREGELVYEFLLVPWIGACSHTPPPPPDQIVHVFPAEPFRLAEIFEPVAVEAPLLAGRSLSQVFIRDGVAIIDAGFTARRAAVTSLDRTPKGEAAPSPWPFLQK